MSALGLRFAGGIEAPVIVGLSAVSGSEAPSVAYATVYPLSMILRVLSAQLLVMYLVR